MGEFIKGGEGDLFVQERRAEPFQHLTCVGVGDLPLPAGDLTPVYCPDDSSKGKFLVAGYIRGEPRAATTSLTRPLSTVYNWLLEHKCGFEALVTYSPRGTRSDPDNFLVAAILYGAQPTDSSIPGPSVAGAPGEDGRINTSMDISYMDRWLIYHLGVARQTVRNTAAANGIAFLPPACESEYGVARDICDSGFIALDGTLYDSEIKYRKKATEAWLPTATDPFVSGGDASDVVVVETVDGHRVIVARGSSTVGEPAEIAYSENYGTTWYNVYVGTELLQTIQRLRYFRGKLYAAASDGYIYVSADLGVNWAVLEDGTEAPGETLYDLVMFTPALGYAVGTDNTFLYTTDGEEWAGRTGPAPGVPGADLLSVAVNDRGHVFVGATDGILYASENGGQNWVTRLNLGAGSVDWAEFSERERRYIGGLIHNTADSVGTFYRSVDGGATWRPAAGQAGDWNSGLNRGFICDQNHFILIGEPHDGGMNNGATTFIATVGPTG